MCKRVFATGFALLILVLSVGTASAQTPFIAVYFDHAYQVEGNPPAPAGDPCPGIDVVGYLYIALVNSNTFVTGVEFAVNYPPEIFWMADLDTQPVTVGNTPNGFSMGWAAPQNGFAGAVFICRPMFLWKCEDCSVPNAPIVVTPHPATGTGFVAFTDFPDYNLIPAVGLTSLICATVPTNETTWGQIKSLYGE